jgi:hypothetical protein
MPAARCTKAPHGRHPDPVPYLRVIVVQGTVLVVDTASSCPSQRLLLTVGNDP